jgi:O-antigen/teichoic acid export membrane protein
MTRNLTGRTLKSAAWLGGASVVRLALRVISVAILARLLTPHEYGVMAGAIVAMEFAALTYTLGLAPTLVQRKEVRPDHIATAFTTSITLAILTGAGIWLSATAIADVIHIFDLREVLRVLAFVTPFGAFNTLCEALLARNMQAKSVALRPLFSFTLATFFIAIPMAYTGFGYWSLVAAQIAEVILGALAFAVAAWKYLVWPGFSREAFRELWRMSLGFSVHQPLAYAATNGDQFLIARLIGADALGLYSRASFLVKNASNLFGNIARIAMFPAMAQVQDQQGRLQNAMLKALYMTALVALPISAFSTIFSSEIVNLLLGSQWTAATLPFALLSATLYLRLGRRACYALFQALGHPYWMSVAHAINAVILILGIWYAAPYGLGAICAVIVVVMIAVMAIALFMVKRTIGVTFWSIAVVHGPAFGLGAAIAAICAILKMSFASLPGPAVLLMGLLASALLTLLLLRLAPRWLFDPYGADILREVQSILPVSSRRLWPPCAHEI